MALAESQCYTIINSPELTDVYNEMKLKKDLGKTEHIYPFHYLPEQAFLTFSQSRARRRKRSGGNT